MTRNAKEPRRYSEAYVETLRRQIEDLSERLKHAEVGRDIDRLEIRRYEALIDSRWDELQRLRDLVYAIATHTSPRNVVEREIEKLGGAIEAMTPKEKKIT